MNTVSNTAYYCCGIRMLDASKETSVCHDIYAERFMDDAGMKIFEPFRSEKMPNISNICRCRLIDDYLKAEIANKPDQKIISIGAGFDSRPYRLKGGDWLEIDEQQIIDIKNEKLPITESTNPLHRVSINFAEESLADKLEQYATDAHTVFVIEGVFMYLEPDAISTTLKALQQHFPNHVLYCDLMGNRFFQKFAQSVHNKLVNAGGEFTERPEAPEELFINRQYLLLERVPTFKLATELGILWREVKIPSFVSWLLLNLLLRDLNGYAVHQFKFSQN